MRPDAQRDRTFEECVKPNLVVMGEDEFRALIHSVAEELRRERAAQRKAERVA